MDHEIAERALCEWEAAFRADAAADQCASLMELTRRFDLEVDPQQLLESTIDFVTASISFQSLDGDAGPRGLGMQAYHPDPKAGGIYAITFDICRSGAARVVTSAALIEVDFADLYGMPWQRHRVVGYSEFFISRIDGVDLTSDELADLERRITGDLLFDYSEDELDFWFDTDTYAGALRVGVNDHVAEDD